MPKSHLRKILIVAMLAIILPPLLLLAWGPRYYKKVKHLAYRLSPNYWHLAYPLAWWN